MDMSDKQLRMLTEALINSNWIENEYGLTAHRDAMRAFQNLWFGDGELTITTGLILTAHEVLLECLNARIAGKFRTCAVSVGGRHFTDPKSKDEIEEQVKDWCKCNAYWEKIHHDTESDYAFEHIKNAHIDFEQLHPFEDGNGRVGRILMNVMALKAGLDPIVIKVEDRFEYYKWFK